METENRLFFDRERTGGMKQKQTAGVLSQREAAPGIFDMWIETSLAAEAAPGQFICIYPRDRSTLLPRPISVCETDGQKGRLRVVYRVAGAGTREFSGYGPGEKIGIMGMLGNGFPLEAGLSLEQKEKDVFLIGGGIGIPPLVELAKRLRAESIRIILGYRDGDLFLKEDLEKYGRVYVATQDGSAGTRGNVMDVLAQEALEAGVIYACGPMPMLRAVKTYALEQGILAYLSLEERMACGVGACLGCVAKTTRPDAHSHVNNARICTEGPVFEAREVDI